MFEDEGIMSVIVITKVDDNICELKNIATVKYARGKGYGRQLMQYRKKYKKMIVGTTENNIPFYVKCGTVKNFFCG